MINREKFLAQIDEVIAKGPYHDDWDSLGEYEPPKWYRDAKFGIFIHWGIYSVPAFGNEWYARNMYTKGSAEYEHHIKTYGAQKDFGYKDFIPMFGAEKFNAEEWAELFSDAGAQYVMPVAEHHDGFVMYKTELSHWNAAEMGPKRDVLGELFGAFKKRGITCCASSHRIEHWFFMGPGREFESDINEEFTPQDLYWPSMKPADPFDIHSEPTPSKEFLEDWLMRCCELVDRYQPRIVYFDWWIQHAAAKPYLKKFAAYYYNRAAEQGYDAVVNYKHDAFMFGTAVPDVERGQFAEIKPFIWQSDTSVALNSWGYTENNRYKEPNEIICDLIDIVSKNGRMLLNIGPKADGTIPEEDAHILREIGKWLKINGKAIYGTRCYRTSSEGPTQIEEGQFTDGIKKEFTPQDIRYTVKGAKLYAIVLKCAEDGEYALTLLGDRDASQKANFKGIIRDVSALGSDEKPRWSQDQEALHISCGLKSDYPIVFEITID